MRTWKVLCCCWLLSLFSLPASAEEKSPPESLMTVLQRRSDMISSLRADVCIEEKAGKDRGRLLQAMLEFADYVGTLYTKEGNREKGQALAKKVRKNAEAFSSPFPQSTTFYRYYEQAPDLIRLEDWGATNPAGEVANKREPVIRLFNGERWVDYSPATQMKNGGNVPRRPQILIQRGQWENRLLEVALGEGVPVERSFEDVGVLSGRAKILGEITWSEFSRLVAPNSVTNEKVPLPGEQNPVPFLAAGVSPWEPGWYRYRLRVWFDPKASYHPLRMDCEILAPDAVAKKHKYIRMFVFEWQDFETTPTGIVVARKCLRHTYQFFGPVKPNVPADDWQSESYEVAQQQILFSHVEVNQDLPANLFRLRPPAGTAVVDQITQSQYVVGSAGEELQKTALGIPPADATPEARGASGWWKTLTWLNIPLITVAIVVFWFQRRKHLRVH